MEFSAQTDKNFCLKEGVNGELKLKTDHQYCYQVQLHLIFVNAYDAMS